MTRKKEPEVFFLRGYMRSGTNWLGRVLNLHPDINCQGEFHLEHFGQAKTRIDRSVSCFILDGKKDVLDREYYGFVKTLVREFCGRDHKFVGDRTPVGISTLFVPNSKYLLIHRDGRDVVVSWFKHVLKTVSKNKQSLKRYKGFTNHPEMIHKVKKTLNNKNYFEVNKQELLDCESYFRHIASQWNTRVVNDQKMSEIAKDKKALNIQILWIPYEKLHGSPEVERAKIYSFLGADPTLAAPLDKPTLPGFSKKIVPGQSRGVVGSWTQYFNETTAQWFDEEAGEALKILGYPSTREAIKNQPAQVTS